MKNAKPVPPVRYRTAPGMPKNYPCMNTYILVVRGILSVYCTTVPTPWPIFVELLQSRDYQRGGLVFIAFVFAFAPSIVVRAIHHCVPILGCFEAMYPCHSAHEEIGLVRRRVKLGTTLDRDRVEEAREETREETRSPHFLNFDVIHTLLMGSVTFT